MNDKLEPEDLEGLITAKEAAKLLRSHIALPYRLALQGKVRAWKRAGRLFFVKADLLALYKPVVPQPDPRPLVEPPNVTAKRNAETEAILREAGIL